MDRVRAIDGKTYVLDTGAELAISRARKKGFVEAFTHRESLTPRLTMLKDISEGLQSLGEANRQTMAATA